MLQKSVIKNYLKELDTEIIDSAFEKFQNYFNDADRKKNIKLLINSLKSLLDFLFFLEIF